MNEGKTSIRKAEFKVKGTCSFFIYFACYHLTFISVSDAWPDTGVL